MSNQQGFLKVSSYGSPEKPKKVPSTKKKADTSSLAARAKLPAIYAKAKALRSQEASPIFSKNTKKPVTLHHRSYTYKYQILKGNNNRAVLTSLRRRPWWHGLSQNDISEGSNVLPSFIWEMYKNSARYKSNAYKQVMLNHLQNNNGLVSKKGLYFTLKKYTQEHDLDLLSIVPRTFYLSSNPDSSISEIKDFIRYNEEAVAKGALVKLAEEAEDLIDPVDPVEEIADEKIELNIGDSVVDACNEVREPEMSSSETSEIGTPSSPAVSLTDSDNLDTSCGETKRRSKKKRGQGDEGVVWIIKPASHTNRGFGIKVLRGVHEVLRIVNGGCSPPMTSSLPKMIESKEEEKKIEAQRSQEALTREAKARGRKDGWIVQEYMISPMLVAGRKFDIRCFVVLTQCARKGVKAYFFDQAYVRTSSKAYSLSSLKDREAHLTNDAVQKHSKAYGKFEDGNKLSFSEWQAWVDKDYPTAPPNLVEGIIYPEIKRLTALSIEAAADQLKNTETIKSFELLGYDYMINSQYEPKLIEINSNPCLEFAGSLLKTLIPTLLEHTVRVALDPVFPPPPCGQRTKFCEETVTDIDAEPLQFRQIYP